jgi:signal transduction histidine kinase
VERTGEGAGAAADSARQLIEAKLAEMTTTIELHRAGKTNEAFAVVASDIGKTGMDQIRARLYSAFEVGAQQREASLRSIFRALELRRWTVHGLALVAALALLGYLQRMWAEAQARESARSLLEREVEARTVDLRALAANLQTMQEDERARLSRELHDELGGLLTAAKLDLARATRAADMTQAAERIAQAGRRIDEVVGVKRRIIEDLRPTALEHLGLAKALELLSREAGQRLGIPVTTRVDDVVLTADGQITVYRLVQEALTNIQKYAKAKRVDVAVVARGAQVEVAVEDDGKGFDIQDVRVGRHGLAGMRYRVEALGGRLQVRSAPGQGTRIAVSLPVAAEFAAPAAPATASS